MADNSELRKLLAEIWTAPSQDRRDAIRRQFEAALPRLLDENDRLRLAGIKNGLKMSAQEERIAQLEAAIQELIEGGSMDEKDMLLAYAALAEGKEPAKF